MDLFEALYTRRSIRSFTEEAVAEADLETLLRAAMAAPSAGNAQPWHFVVVTERAVLDAIPGIHPYAAMCKTAQAAVIVCAELALEKYPGYWVLGPRRGHAKPAVGRPGPGHRVGVVRAVSAAGAHDGHGRAAPAPRRHRAPCPVAFGHPAQEFKKIDRFKPERIHRNGW